MRLLPIAFFISQMIRKSLPNRVFVVGPLPPPVQGASVITQQVIELLQSRAVDVVAVNVSPTVLTRNWRWHASRASAYLRCCCTLMRAPRRSKVYLSLSGGYGLAYDSLVAMITRLKAHHLTLHHHSFNYITRWRWAFACLLRAAPSHQTHIVLCKEMQVGIERRYRRRLTAVPASNFNFFRDETEQPAPRSELRRVGFLSNITMEKGIDRFLDLAEQLAASGIEAHIAGPVAAPELKAYIEERMRALGNVKYLGPLFGPEKHEFYRNIDLFVLPSRYVNEAEPLVVYEAMAAGLPVAVTARGCLCEFADKPFVIVMDRDAADLGPVVLRVEQWIKDRPLFEQASIAVLEHMKAMREDRSPQLGALLSAITSSADRENRGVGAYPRRVAG